MGKKLLDTSTHRTILDDMLKFASDLDQGSFINNNGSATGLFVGAKGIGKSLSCKVGLEAVSIQYLKVLALYIDFYGITDHHHRLNQLPLIDNIVMEALPFTLPWLHAAFLGSSGSALLEVVMEYLDKNGTRLMLVVDEMDELYRKKPTPVHGSTLGILQSLGNSRQGSVAIRLCGSSAVLPLLIGKNYREDTEFPLYKGAPNLNGTKYAVILVPTPFKRRYRSATASLPLSFASGPQHNCILQWNQSPSDAKSFSSGTCGYY